MGIIPVDKAGINWRREHGVGGALGPAGIIGHGQSGLGGGEIQAAAGGRIIGAGAIISGTAGVVAVTANVPTPLTSRLLLGSILAMFVGDERVTANVTTAPGREEVAVKARLVPYTRLVGLCAATNCTVWGLVRRRMVCPGTKVSE